MSNKEVVNPTTPMHFVASTHSRTSILNRELKTDDGNGKRNENVIDLDWQNNNFARVRLFFWYISLPSLHDYDVKVPIISRFQRT